MFRFLFHIVEDFRLGRAAARGFSSLCVGTALLAIANFDGMLTVPIEAPTSKVSVRRYAVASEVFAKRPPAPTEQPQVKSIDDPKLAENEFRASLLEDEILDRNPFNNLSDMHPIDDIVAKRISRFKRVTYRSPKFKAEFGYDVLHYEIHHPDKTHSSVLAFVDNGVQIVRLDVASGIEYNSYMFQDGALIENATTSYEAVQKRIGDQLKTAITFLSVSR